MLMTRLHRWKTVITLDGILTCWSSKTLDEWGEVAGSEAAAAILSFIVLSLDFRFHGHSRFEPSFSRVFSIAGPLPSSHTCLYTKLHLLITVAGHFGKKHRLSSWALPHCLVNVIACDDLCTMVLDSRRKDIRCSLTYKILAPSDTPEALRRARDVHIVIIHHPQLFLQLNPSLYFPVQRWKSWGSPLRPNLHIDPVT